MIMNFTYQLALVSMCLILSDVSASESATKKRKDNSGAARFDERMKQEALALASERLRKVCQNRILGSVESLVKAGADANDLDASTHKSALHLAAENGDYTIVKRLLACGGNPQITDGGGRTSLHWAAMAGDGDVISLLLRDLSRESVNQILQAKNLRGEMALHAAAAAGQLESCKVLLDMGCSVNALTSANRTPLHLAAYYGHTHLATYLIGRGASLTLVTAGGFTALHEAAFRGHAKTAAALIERDINKETVDSNGLTALHVGIQQGHKEVVALLLGSKCNANAQLPNGDFLVHMAARLEATDLFELLIQYGAQKDALNKEKYTPLNLALHEGLTRVTSLMQEPDKTDIDKKLTALHKDIHYVVASLLEQGCKKNFPLPNGDYTLHTAVRIRSQNLCDLLIKHGAQKDALNKEGYTPVHVAVQEELDLLALHLVELGADPEIRTPQGKTASAIVFHRELKGTVSPEQRSRFSSANTALAVALFNKRKEYQEKHASTGAVASTSTQAAQPSTSLRQEDLKQ